jgi:hypothetical protein
MGLLTLALGLGLSVLQALTNNAAEAKADVFKNFLLSVINWWC